MPAYFRFLTLLAMKVFLEEAVSVCKGGGEVLMGVAWVTCAHFRLMWQ